MCTAFMKLSENKKAAGVAAAQRCAMVVGRCLQAVEFRAYKSNEKKAVFYSRAVADEPHLLGRTCSSTVMRCNGIHRPLAEVTFRDPVPQPYCARQRARRIRRCLR